MHLEICPPWLTRSIGDSANDATNPVRAPATKYSGLFSRLPIRCGPLRMDENCNNNQAAVETLICDTHTLYITIYSHHYSFTAF